MEVVKGTGWNFCSPSCMDLRSTQSMTSAHTCGAGISPGWGQGSLLPCVPSTTLDRRCTHTASARHIPVRGLRATSPPTPSTAWGPAASRQFLSPGRVSAQTPQSLTSGGSSVSCADQRGRWGRGGVRKRRQADRRSSEAPEKPLSAAAGAHGALDRPHQQLHSPHRKGTPGQMQPGVSRGGGCSTLRYREVRRDSRPEGAALPSGCPACKAVLCPVPCGPALICLHILAPSRCDQRGPCQSHFQRPVSTRLPGVWEARSPASLLSQRWP